MNESHYNKKFKGLARSLRNDGTPGEIRLWSEVLRARKFYGLQFNRQYAIDNYIVDFISRKAKLIIEVDGRSHQYKVDEDAKRDHRLGLLGYRVVRVGEEEVMRDLQNVIRTLEAALPDEIFQSLA